ncbi:hypothetical protein D3C71_1867120 [compost metagenome]
MEKRQCRHKPIFGGKVSDRFDLLNVCQNTFMAVDNALWMAFRTGGEKNYRRVFWLLFILR